MGHPCDVVVVVFYVSLNAHFDWWISIRNNRLTSAKLWVSKYFLIKQKRAVLPHTDNIIKTQRKYIAWCNANIRNVMVVFN